MCDAWHNAKRDAWHDAKRDAWHDAKRDGDQHQPGIYEIRLQGQLDEQWADWFGGLVVQLGENGETILTGPVVDQAALHGLLKKVRDLGMPLLSVNRIETGEAESNGPKG